MLRSLHASLRKTLEPLEKKQQQPGNRAGKSAPGCKQREAIWLTDGSTPGMDIKPAVKDVWKEIHLNFTWINNAGRVGSEVAHISRTKSYFFYFIYFFLYLFFTAGKYSRK